MTAADDQDVVCLCCDVTRGRIRQAIRDGARSVDEISQATRAGTACGGCIPELEALLAEAKGRKG